MKLCTKFERNRATRGNSADVIAISIFALIMTLNVCYMLR